IYTIGLLKNGSYIWSVNQFYTVQPASTPTIVPTVAPTAIPTAIPTAVPTVQPTAIPTPIPTPIPTSKPTLIAPDISISPSETAAPGTPMTLTFTQEANVTYQICLGNVSGNYSFGCKATKSPLNFTMMDGYNVYGAVKAINSQGESVISNELHVVAKPIGITEKPQPVETYEPPKLEFKSDKGLSSSRLLMVATDSDSLNDIEQKKTVSVTFVVKGSVDRVDVDWQLPEGGNRVSSKYKADFINGEVTFSKSFPISVLTKAIDPAVGFKKQDITVTATAYNDENKASSEMLRLERITLYDYKGYNDMLTFPLSVYDFWQKNDSGVYLTSCAEDDINFDAQFKIKNTSNRSITISQLALSLYSQATDRYIRDLHSILDSVPLETNTYYQFPKTNAVISEPGNYKLVARVYYDNNWYRLQTLNFSVIRNNQCPSAASVPKIEDRANTLLDKVENKYGQPLNLGASNGNQTIDWPGGQMVYRQYPQSGYYAGVDSGTESFHYLAPGANEPVSLGGIEEFSESLTKNGASNDTVIFESISDALHSNDPRKAVTSYLLSKGVGELVSIEIGAAVTIFFDKAYYSTISEFLNPKGYKAIEAAFENFASDTSKLKDLGKLTEGAITGIIFSSIGDELKKNFPVDGFYGKVGNEVGIDILMAAAKNGVSALKTGYKTKSGQAALLVWQVGFAADMAGIALEKNIKAIKEGIVFMNAENEMYTSFFNGAMQAKSGYDKANILQNLLNTSGASQQEKQIYTDKIIKYRKIAEESANVLAENIKSYYVERGKNFGLILSEKNFDRLGVEDIKSVMIVATAIREDIIDRSADSLPIVGGKLRRLENGFLIC
ncbi:MAG: PT domain-containing protein, partial [Methylococcales bacterium]